MELAVVQGDKVVLGKIGVFSQQVRSYCSSGWQGGPRDIELVLKRIGALNPVTGWSLSASWNLYQTSQLELTAAGWSLFCKLVLAVRVGAFTNLVSGCLL